MRHDAVDLGEIVRKAADRLRPQFDDQEVVLTVELPPLPVSGDPDRFTQVIVNLLGNALAHTPSGGRVTVGGRRNGGRIEVTVADTGTGIAEHDLGRVFDRFYRGDSSRPGGTGIGLTIAREIARAHHGDLTAHSDGSGREPPLPSPCRRPEGFLLFTKPRTNAIDPRKSLSARSRTPPSEFVKPSLHEAGPSALAHNNRGGPCFASGGSNNVV